MATPPRSQWLALALMLLGAWLLASSRESVSPVASPETTPELRAAVSSPASVASGPSAPAPTTAPVGPGSSLAGPRAAPSPTPAAAVAAVDRSTAVPSPAGFARPGDDPRAHPGPFLLPAQRDFALDSFSSGRRLAGAYYYYWYDWPSRLGLEPPPVLPRPPDEPRFRPRLASHPPNRQEVSFCNPAWHRREIEDMLAAGLDFFLPVYQGQPGRYGRADGAPVCGTNRQRPEGDYWAWRDSPTFAAVNDAWSTDGLGPLVEALDTLTQAGQRPPRVGLFLDASILNGTDLRTEPGKALFYTAVRDFFSRVPPRYWAAIDERPLIWLSDPRGVGAVDQSSFDYLNERFPRDFGGRTPFIARERGWQQPGAAGGSGPSGAPPIRTDEQYAWGAAEAGSMLGLEGSVIAQVGPGFDTRGWPAERFVDRRDGQLYRQQLAAALHSGRQIVMIETWNNWIESSAIDSTVEWGRTYIDITRRCLDLFHRGEVPSGDQCGR